MPPTSHLTFADPMGGLLTPAFSPGAIIMAEMRDSICVTPDSIYIEADQFTEILPSENGAPHPRRDASLARADRIPAITGSYRRGCTA